MIKDDLQTKVVEQAALIAAALKKVKTLRYGELQPESVLPKLARRLCADDC